MQAMTLKVEPRNLGRPGRRELRPRPLAFGTAGSLVSVSWPLLSVTSGMAAAAGPKPGARSSFWVSHTFLVSLVLGLSSVAFPGTFVGSWIRSGGVITRTGVHRDARPPPWFV